MDYDAVQDVAALGAREYEAFVTWYKTHFAQRLQAARGDAQKVQQAIAAYRANGEKAGLPRGAITDFFCVDTPSVLEMAGYSDAEIDTAVAFYHEDPDSPSAPAGS